MRDIRIATVVCNAKVGRIRENLDKTAFFAARARSGGARLICFPELNITGYTTRTGIGDTAVSIPGPVSQELLRIAAANDILILAGVAEKDDQGSVYASHLAAGPAGDLQIYRKVHIAPPEKERFSGGEEIRVFRSLDLCFGIQLCYDAHFPELSARMALAGAEILFIPHASPRGLAVEKHISWMRHLTARAYDNSVFVVACNQTGDNGLGLSFPGNAVVINPAGNVIHQSLSGRERVMLTDLKAEEFLRVRNNPMHFFLPGRRDDLY